MNKSFLILLVIALGLGVSLGLAFAGGVAMGKSGGDEAPTAVLSPPGGNFSTQGGQSGPGSGGQSGPRAGGQFQGRFSAGPTGSDTTAGDAQVTPRQGGMPSVSGTVESIDSPNLTIKTDAGETLVIVGESTSISKVSQVSIEDIQVGEEVTVIGASNDDGNVEASAIVISPDGAVPFFRGGSTRGSGPRGLP